MTQGHGNQHASRRGRLLILLDLARQELRDANLMAARFYLGVFQFGYNNAPASTRRRWKCGR